MDTLDQCDFTVTQRLFSSKGKWYCSGSVGSLGTTELVLHYKVKIKCMYFVLQMYNVKIYSRHILLQNQ